MHEIHIRRKAINAQSVLFAPTVFPGEITARNESGDLQAYTFINERSQVEDFFIDNGGSIQLDADKPHHAHNVATLRAIKRTAGMLPRHSDFEIIDFRQQAAISSSSRHQMLRALNMVQTYVHDEEMITNMARRLGIGNVALYSPDERLNYIEDLCEKAPDTVLALHENIYRDQLFMLDAAIEARIVEIKAGGVYWYRNATMGGSEEAVIEFFRQQPDILDVIDRQVSAHHGKARPLTVAAEATTSPEDNEVQKDVNAIDIGKLVDEAIEAGLMAKGDEGKYYTMNHIHFVVPRTTHTDARVRAEEFLAINKSVAKMIQKALKQK